MHYYEVTTPQVAKMFKRLVTREAHSHQVIREFIKDCHPEAQLHTIKSVGNLGIRLNWFLWFFEGVDKVPSDTFTLIEKTEKGVVCEPSQHSVHGKALWDAQVSMVNKASQYPYKFWDHFICPYIGWDSLEEPGVTYVDIPESDLGIFFLLVEHPENIGPYGFKPGADVQEITLEDYEEAFQNN